MDINVSTLQGRLVDIPKFYKAEDGNTAHDRAFCRLAVKRFDNKTPDYFCITAWGPRAHTLIKFGKKGKVVGFTGHLHTNPKLRPDGTYDNYFELVADHIYLGPDVKDGPKEKTPEEPKVSQEEVNKELLIQLAKMLQR